MKPRQPVIRTNVAIPPDLYEAIAEMAIQQEVSRNALIVSILAKALRKEIKIQREGAEIMVDTNTAV